MMIAPAASASLTSLSVIAPDAAWIILTATSSLDNFNSESLKASTDPFESALKIRFNSFKSSCLNWSDKLQEI